MRIDIKINHKIISKKQEAYCIGDYQLLTTLSNVQEKELFLYDVCCVLDGRFAIKKLLSYMDGETYHGYKGVWRDFFSN